MPAVRDFLAVELDDDVAFLQPGFSGRRVLRHVTDERAGVFWELELLRQLRGDRLNHHAEITARHLAIGDEPLHNVASEIDGHGKADALVAAAPADDGLIDADQPAFNVHERAAGIAGIDRGISLDEVLVIHDAHAAAALGADDA